MVRGLCMWWLLATVSLTGCSGGGTARGRPLDKARFVSSANAICVKDNRRISALQKPTDVPGVGTYMAAALPIEEEAKAKLDALVPPVSDQKRYARLLDMIAQSVSKASEVRGAIEAGDERRVQRLGNDLAALQQRENGVDEELGLTQCVSNEETEG
jgi:hypothetical protein